MAKRTTQILLTCPHCDYSSREKGYGTITTHVGRKGKCPGCGSTDLKVEDKHHRFLRLASARLARVLATMDSLQNMANPNYKWEPDDIKRMVKILTDKVEAVRRAFGPPEPPRL